MNEKDCKMASVRLSIPVQIKREKAHFAEGEKNPVAQTHNPEEEKQHPARVPGNPRHWHWQGLMRNFICFDNRVLVRVLVK